LDKYEPMLRTANLGDSGYLLLRKQGLDLVSIFRTKEQSHSFNFPYQVGTGGDDPAVADTQDHTIQDRDIIVLGSDGLFDNLFDIKIIELLRPFLRDRDDILDPSLVAEIIAKEAERYSYNMNYVSPFAKGAHEHFYDYSGGKPDDITVIVAQAILAESKSSPKKPE
jgi:protein phosphatase PTC7